MADVPNVAGVPALTSYSTAPIPVLAFDDVGDYPNTSLWGIYDSGSGEPVITADTIAEFDYKQEWVLSDYPIEQGAFETYDKVQTPFEVKIQFVAGGSEANREAMLSSIAAVAGDLNLYDAVTPEATYQSCNISHYSYARRAEKGVGLLVVEVWLLQVRTSADAAPATLSDTQSPSAQSPVSGGFVQPSTPTAAQSSGVIST